MTHKHLKVRVSSGCNHGNSTVFELFIRVNANYNGYGPISKVASWSQKILEKTDIPRLWNQTEGVDIYSKKGGKDDHIVD